MIKNQFGETVSQKKVLRLMGENDVLSVVRRKRYKQDVYEKIKETLKNIPENLLQRDFTASEPNKVYVSDITYLYGRFQDILIRSSALRHLIFWQAKEIYEVRQYIQIKVRLIFLMTSEIKFWS